LASGSVWWHYACGGKGQLAASLRRVRKEVV
jgi:hypothetical protein